MNRNDAIPRIDGIIRSLRENVNNGLVPASGGSFIAAEIWMRGTLISLGRNQYKSHPLQKRFAKNEHAIHLHAEIDAIRNALMDIKPDDLRRCTMLIGRIRRNAPGGQWITGLAAPCNGCLRAIMTFGIKDLWWSTNEADVIDGGPI